MVAPGIQWGAAGSLTRPTFITFSTAVEAAYLLFSQTKTTGRFQMAAIFRASWKVPILVAPSPKKQAAMRGRFRYWKAKAQPAAIGMPPPTMAIAGNIPASGSPTCIDPPLARQQPVFLANNSAIRLFTETPRAIACE